MRGKMKRIMAGLLSAVVACSMMLGGAGLETVLAEGESEVGDGNIDTSGTNDTGATSNSATISVTFRDDSASYGQVLIYNGTGWVNYTQMEGEGAKTASKVRIVLNAGYVISWGEITWRVDTGNPVPVPEDVQTALLGEDGYQLPSGHVYELESVTFKSNEEIPDEGENTAPTFWADAYNQYLGNGINILSQWVGSSQGTITYEFSDSYNGSSWTGKTELDQSTVEGVLANVDSSNEKAKLFGIAKSGQYLRLKTGSDLGGNHLGFEVYKKNELGDWDRQNDVTISYYDYRTGKFVAMTDQNRDWESYLKGSYHVDGEEQDRECGGLVIDLKGFQIGQETVDLTSESNTYALRCLLPFDSRKNISWWNAKYKAQVEAAGDSASDDQLVENGTVELVKVVGTDGKVYYSNEAGWRPEQGLDENLVVQIEKAGYDSGGLRPGYAEANDKFTAEEMLEAAEKASGQCNVPMNSTVTVKLIPDAGYQILKASLNGMQLTPDAEVPSQFSFKVDSNIHFSAMFERTHDVVSIKEASEISEAQISGTTEAIDTGNVALTVTSASGSNNEAALQVVSGEAVAALDVKIDQIIAKAGKLSDAEQAQARNGALSVTGDKFWTENLSELRNPVNITLDLNDVTLAENETLTIVRQHGEEYAELTTTVTRQNGTVAVSFDSDKFSTYTIIKKAGSSQDSGDSSEGSSDGSQSGSSSGGSWGGSSGSFSGSSTPAADTTTDNTKTETKSDGTKVETKTDTKADGTKVDTKVETKTDGTKVETVVETAKDGSVKTTETVMKADGSATKTEKETETNTKGNKVAITVTTEKDAKGKVTGITQTSEIEKISGSASATVTVEKAADGKTISAEAEVDKKGANSKKGVGATLSGSIIAQIEEAANTKSVNICMTVTAGEKEYTVKADTKDLKAGNKLKVMSIDEKTGNYVMVNAKTYTVNKSGSVKVVLPEGMTYQLMDTKEAATVEKKILSTVKAKKTAVTVEKGKKTAIQLSKKLDMDNVEKINYSTNKTDVVTVNKNGTVTAKKSGKVTVQAEVLLKNGKTKTVKMTVTVKP
ncbi:MAG: hypothetical protein PUK75_14240 [bacterium]|nr:hypothetical protein [bacterium]MDY4099850.1 hypothetical protein [Lachnospiraceae bacterium]